MEYKNNNQSRQGQRQGRDDRDNQGYRGGQGGGFRGGNDRGGRGGNDRGRGGRGGFQNEPQTSLVAPGQQVPLQINYFKMKTKNQGIIYAYSIQWGENIDDRDEFLKKEARRSLRDTWNEKFGMHICWGNLLFCTQDLEDEEFEFKANAGGKLNDITMKKSITINLNDLTADAKDYMNSILQYFNIVIKQAMREKKYEQIGRLPKFFLALDQIIVQEVQNLKAWPGYEITAKQCTQGIFLNVDSCTKFVQMETVLEQLNVQLQEGYSPKDLAAKYDSSNIDNPRVTVLTSHNSKTYQVDGLDTQLSPSTFKFKLKDGSEVSMQQYFFDRYKIKLNDKQPLLYVNNRKTGQKTYLPTSICHHASLPQGFTNDAFKMRQIQGYRITSAQKRMDRIMKLIQNLNQDQTLLKWGVEIDQNATNIMGKKLYEPNIINHKGQDQPISDFYGRKVKHLQNLDINTADIGFAYDGKDFNLASELWSQFIQASKGLGIQISGSENDIQWIETKGGKYLQSVKDTLENVKDKKYYPQIIFVLLQREKDKGPIKSYLDSKGVVSQFMLQKNMQKKVKVMGVMTNLLRQVNAKLHLDLFRLKLSKKITDPVTMFVGIDVCHQGRKSVVGLSASSSSYLSQHFSYVKYQALNQELIGKKNVTKDEIEEDTCKGRTKILIQFIRDALDNWKDQNKGQVPKQIVIYRDGVGGPSFQEKCLKLEGPGGELMEAIKGYAPNYDPKILYVFINKRITTRFFEKFGNGLINPGPGTLVDSTIVQQDGDKIFDFYMVANDNPTSATAIPVHYEVAINTTNISKQEIQEMIYHQCYNYYGFGGPIKVPATAFYAHKVAYYAYDNFNQSAKSQNQEINENLFNYLHFL